MEETSEKKPYFYHKGDVIEGTVVKVTNYGAFMIFDHDVNGLLHISEITNTFVYNVYNMMKIGTTKKVLVLDVNPDNGFLKVSIKKLTKEIIEETLVDGKIRTPVDEDEIDFSPIEKEMNKWKEEMK